MIENDLRRIDKLIKRNGPCRRLIEGMIFTEAREIKRHRPGGSEGGTPLYRLGWEFDALMPGGQLEDTSQLVEAAIKSAREAKEELRAIANECGDIGDVILPSLMDHVKLLRDARFALTTEAGQCLASLKEVRKFFFDSDYHMEMARLKEFIGLCNELKQLQSDGTLDAISDVMLKLAVGTDHAGK